MVILIFWGKVSLWHRAWEGSLDLGGTSERFDRFILTRTLQTWELFSVAETEIIVHLFFHLKGYLIHGQNFKKNWDMVLHCA